MDPVSYSKASQQEQRIKKIVADPDSVAGLVSVPNLVPTGETITIPAGRTVVHPNLQVDGTLNVQGTMFIPSGGIYSPALINADVVQQGGLNMAVDSTVVHKTGDETIAGVKTFNGTVALPSTTSIGTVTSTEIGYVDGVTSAIQTQLDSKQRMQLMTAQNSTSGTSIDFTGIPSWAKKITVMFSGVSTIGTSHKLIQLGSGSVQTTGYSACGGYLIGTVGATSSDVGFLIWTVAPSGSSFGQLTFSHMGSNLWVCSGSLYANDAQYLLFTSGAIPLSGVLDRLRITTVNGTDTFDAGQINVLYEG